MTKEDLIPNSQRTKAELSAMGKKGGSVGGRKKSIAAKLRELKKRGLTSESCKRLHEMLTQEDMCDIEVLLAIETFKNKIITLSDRSNFIRMLIEFRKLRYGVKERHTNTNLNLNVDATALIEKAYLDRMNQNADVIDVEGKREEGEVDE